MLKVILHPGFHKTGTTSLQRMVTANRHILANKLQFFLPKHMHDLSFAARRLAITGKQKNAENLTRLTRDFSRNFSNESPILISNEHLCGVIPGRKDTWSYAYAPHILQTLVDAIVERFDAKVEICIWFTTRQPEDWMKSVYWQNLRSNRIVEDFDEYRKKLEPVATLDSTISKVESVLGNRVRVESTDCEHFGSKDSPLRDFLEYLAVDFECLSLINRQNIQPMNGTQELLRLNRLNVSEEELTKLKRAFLDDHRRTG